MLRNFHRHLDGPLDVPVACDPKSHGDNDRENFEPEIASRKRNNFVPQIFHARASSRRAFLSLALSMFSVTLPPTTKATVPSCSEMTMATASVSSVTPMAARCRVPSFSSSSDSYSTAAGSEPP